ncbi:MAG: hypothetical protein WC251_01290, partial [Candidatus Izemoplasmatales bacterium]
MNTMKLLKRFFTVFALAALVISFVGCKDETTTATPTTAAPTTVAPTTVAPTTAQPTTVAPTTVAPTTVPVTTAEPGPIAIQTVLETFTSNDPVIVQGVIYYVFEEGFLISDSALGKILVNVGDSYDDQIGIAVGKEVEVTGTFKVASDMPFIDAPTDITVVNASATVPTPDAGDIVSLQAKSKTAKTGSWYQYVELVGKIVYDEVTTLVKIIDDDENVIEFSTSSDNTALRTQEGNRVTVRAVVNEYATFGNVWRLTFVGEATDVVATPYTVAEVTAMLENWFSETIPAEIKGTLTLPAVYDKIDDLTITWATSIPSDIEILALEPEATTYQTNVSLPDADVPGTLTATIDYMEEDAFNIVLNVTVKHLEPTSLETALDSGDTLVMFEAVVMAIVENYTNAINSMLVQDLDNPDVIIAVDYDREELEVGVFTYGLLTTANPAVGDIVIVAGTHRTSGRPSIVDPIVTT